MNLREIDRLVAEKVMGWNKVRLLQSGNRIDWYGFKPGEYGVSKVPKYSTKIADAWQVVEKLKIAVIPQAGDPPTDMKYLAEIDRKPFGDNYEAYAGTAELAICLVALKSVGVNIE